VIVGPVKEVDGRDDLEVAWKKSRPELANWIGGRSPAKISRHGTRRHLEAEVKNLAMDPWRRCP
jgi:hypothetical protein